MSTAAAIVFCDILSFLCLSQGSLKPQTHITGIDQSRTVNLVGIRPKRHPGLQQTGFQFSSFRQGLQSSEQRGHHGSQHVNFGNRNHAAKLPYSRRQHWSQKALPFSEIPVETGIDAAEIPVDTEIDAAKLLVRPGDELPWVVEEGALQPVEMGDVERRDASSLLPAEFSNVSSDLGLVIVLQRLFVSVPCVRHGNELTQRE